MRKGARRLWLEMYAVERLMAYVVGLMAYTLFVAVLGVIVARQASEKWSGVESGRMLVSLVFSSDSKEGGNRSAIENALRERLDGLQEVEKYSFIVHEGSRFVLAPSSFVEPIFVSVCVRPGAINVQTLERVLSKVHPLVKVRGVEKKSGVSRHSRVTEMICFLLLLLAFFGALAVIALATQAGLVVNKRIIGTMTLMGATPVYIVRQFQRHTLRLGRQGSILGVIAMLVTFVMLYSSTVQSGFNISHFCSASMIVGCCVGIPLFVIVLMLLATDITVRQYLRSSVDAVDEWSI